MSRTDRARGLLKTSKTALEHRVKRLGDSLSRSGSPARSTSPGPTTSSRPATPSLPSLLPAPDAVETVVNLDASLLSPASSNLSLPHISDGTDPAQAQATPPTIAQTLPTIVVGPAQAPANENEAVPRTSVKALAALHTLLSIAEKALDGLPVWGPKAAVGATAQLVDYFKVRVFASFIRSYC
jgi:hypothetical protein